MNADQRDHRRRDIAIGAGVVLMGLLIRLPPMFHSLWYDEMITLIHYVSGDWKNVVAGSYSPNNHVLFTILAKAVTPDLDVDSTAFFLRLPSLIAGSLIPVVLAWPLRRERPGAALLVAAIAAVHPWLVSSSAFARGYALLLLLAVLATRSLPARRGWIDWRYTLLLLATLYTQPLGIGIAIGHGAAMLLLRREHFWTWFRSSALTGVMTALLYLPMVGGAREYWNAPEKPSVPYRQFIEQAFRHAQAGYDAAGIVHLLTPLLILTAGGYLAWRGGLLRTTVVSFGVASIFGLLVPMVIPLSGEVRALHWLIPVYCIAAAAIIASPMGMAAGSAEPRLMRWTRVGAMAVLMLTLGNHVYAVCTVPAMPIREALARGRSHAPGAPMIAVYMASVEARALYDNQIAVAYGVEDAPGRAGLRPLEQQLPGAPTVVVFYEYFLERDEPELWDHLRRHYALIERLPGRISPAAIYRRK